MQEHEIRDLVTQVRTGRLPRRAFVQHMLAVGLSAPMAGMILAHNGIAFAQTPFAYKPTKAGGGGALKILQWQGPTMLNPHLSTGSKDFHASNIFYESLAGWDMDGNLVAILAEQVPSLENGGVAKDLKSVTWKLKRNVRWHDGMPFTADDCVFNWQYSADPATSAYSISAFRNVTVEKIDTHTIKVVFSRPTPFWADAFVGSRGMIIPKHLFEPYKGARSREAPNNLKPVGTGPYIFVDFKPGDLLLGKINPFYHVANRPHFDAIEVKGGGDAASAARAVLQTGDYDFVWNMQVEEAIVQRLESVGKGKVEVVPGGNIEHIQFNFSDPWTEIDGERSNPKSVHPLFGDKSVREAFNLLLDREAVQKIVYGRDAVATANFVNAPERFVSRSTRWEFSADKANKLLDDAGWKRGADGIREKNGKKLKLVFQTATNPLRQRTQAVFKQACEKAGAAVELKSVDSSVFFSSDPGNPDTFGHFYADMQMYTSPLTQPDPALFMQQFLPEHVAQRSNKWLGRNVTRWVNQEFEGTFKAAETEVDPVKRATLLIKLNDLVINNQVVIPVIVRKILAGSSKRLETRLSSWDTYLWNLASWYRSA